MDKQAQRKAPTIQDVARHANVAVGTVSRVINEVPGVKPKTLQRVLAAIHELDYSPNLIARSMTSRRTGSLGVIVPYFTRPFFNEVLQAVEETITGAGRELVLYNVQNKDQCDAYLRKLSKQRKLDGFLVISIAPDDELGASLRQAGIPVVLIDAYHPLLTSLVIDNIEGAYQAVNYLLEHGHRHIGFINGITEGGFGFNQASNRLLGLQRALAEAGLPFQPDLVITTEWDRQGGREAAWQLLSRVDRPTAIFAASDMHAIGVLEAARSLHISVPGELSLIGYDGIELSEIMELTTVQQPMRYMGELGVQKLCAQIEALPEAKLQPELICLQPNLTIRNTVATPTTVLSPL